MDQATRPSKESIRRWLQSEIELRRAPPDPQQIRRELGWDLVKREQDSKHPKR